MRIAQEIEMRTKAMEKTGDLLLALNLAVEAADDAIRLLLASEEA